MSKTQSLDSIGSPSRGGLQGFSPVSPASRHGSRTLDIPEVSQTESDRGTMDSIWFVTFPFPEGSVTHIVVLCRR